MLSLARVPCSRHSYVPYTALHQAKSSKRVSEAVQALAADIHCPLPVHSVGAGEVVMGGLCTYLSRVERQQGGAIGFVRPDAVEPRCTFSLSVGLVS